jgi:rubrerythrin
MEARTMGDFHLPAPWDAPEQASYCRRCRRVTTHYGRRLTSAADEESDRALGELRWFCANCGTKQGDREPPAAQPVPDELSEEFHRH